MTTDNKIMWKRGEIAPKSNFSSFPHYYIYIFLTLGVKLHIHLLNVVVQFIDFLTLSTLICRGTDISKCFSESLGIRDNDSRLYYWRFHILSSEKISISCSAELKEFIISGYGARAIVVLEIITWWFGYRPMYQPQTPLSARRL